MIDKNEFEELIECHLCGELNEAQKERLAALLDADPVARQQFVEQVRWDTQFAEAVRESPGDDEIRRKALGSTDQRSHQSVVSVMRLMSILAVAAAIIVALTIGLYFQHVSAERRIAEIKENTEQPKPEPSIAKITGLSGSLIWTGDRGQIVRDVKVGTERAGGHR